MQRLLLSLFTMILAFTLLPVHDAEARRLGGGKSYGMQRTAPMKRDATPNQAQNAPSQGNAAAAPSGKRSWMGPIAGLAAGLGLAALFSHFGLGEGMANFLMLALLALAALALVRWLMSRAAPQPLRHAAQTGAGQVIRLEPIAPLPGSVAATAAPGPVSPAPFPPGFDAEAFTRQAKVNFLRMQAANDAGNLDDIREFTTPEMYAEIKLDIDERQGATQQTEVEMLNAETLEALEEDQRQIVSVRFHGMLREDSDTPASFDEIWHLTRPADASRGWVVAGIQQNG